MLREWNKAICETILIKNLEDKKLEKETFIKRFNNLKKESIYDNSLFYDPHFDFYTEFLEGIDEDYSQLWYQYRPCKSYIQKFKSGWKLSNEYSLKITSPITLDTTLETINVKEKYLIKRYYNSSVESVKVFYLNEPPNIFPYNPRKVKGDFKKIEYIKIDEKDINLTLHSKSSYSDLIILYLEDSTRDLVIDNFIPTYPLWLDEKIIILTPILLQQINGCDNENIIQSLYSRVANNLGAILINKSKKFDLPEYKDENSIRGISDYSEGIFKDGRVSLVIPERTKHIPEYGHGWISSDTHVSVVSVLEAVKPKVILELGSWYGLSTRIFSNMNPRKDMTIYSIDRYENNAIYEKNVRNISPNDKLFYNHLRYETFCSNLSY